MDLDALFPQINTNPLDTYPLKNYFIAAYPNFLVLGKPNVVNFKFTFEENLYLKLQPSFYDLWKETFDKIGNKIASNNLGDVEDTPLINYLSFQISWKIKDLTIIFEIKNHNLNKTEIIVDVIEFDKIYKGFCFLLFKPYCLPPFICFTFKLIIEIKPLKQIKCLKNIKDAISLVEEMDLFLNDDSKVYLAAENILRFLSEIILQKKMFTKLNLNIE